MVKVEQQVIRVADECWMALALLHRSHPERSSFSAREIFDRLKDEAIHTEVRPGVQAHIYQHNVANAEPSSARYRMFYRLPNGGYRLFRPGDDYHPNRRGKTAPERGELPAQYHYLLDWYHNEYCAGSPNPVPDSDPLLQMRGVGKETWRRLGGGDAFIARERQGWDLPVLPPEPVAAEPVERVWLRLAAHQGEEFRTARGLLFTYRVEGGGVWFYRNGKRVNRRLGRTDVEKAVQRCPLRKVTDVGDLQDPSYLYGLLTDERIHGSDW